LIAKVFDSGGLPALALANVIVCIRRRGPLAGRSITHPRAAANPPSRPTRTRGSDVKRISPLVAVALFTALHTNPILAQAPTLSYSVPSAVAPGATSDVTFYGGAVNGVTGFWTNLPLTAELATGVEGNGTKADQVVYRFTVPANSPVGVGGVRLATGQGISNLRLFMIDDLPSATKNGANKSIETAQELTLPIAVDGAADPESFDYYKFAGKAGQRVSIEVYAQRLGTALDPVVRLLDPAGKELGFSDDEGGIGIDCRLARTLPADGVYTIEIRDVRYQGGGGHRYRLRVGDFPLVTTTYPLAAQKGTSAQLAVAGPAVEQAAPLDITMPEQVPGSQVSFGAKFPSGQGSAIVTLIASGQPEAVETEPNDAPQQATPIALPAAINGRFEVPKDRDYYQFEAKANQRLEFVGQTRSLGSPTDLFLRVFNADGGLLAEAEDNGIDEGVLNVAFPADGVYRLMVEDLLRRGGPAHAYRVDVRPYQPGFSLTVDAEKYDAPKNGVFVAKVTSARKDYNGPITLELQGVGEGYVLANNVIPEGQNEVLLNVTLPATIESGTPIVFNIVGRAKIGEADFAAKASTLPLLRASQGGLPYPPEALDGSIGLGVGPVFPDFFKLAADPVLFPQIVGAGTLKVKAEKLNNFNDAITLAVAGLPEGFTAEVMPIAAGQAEIAFAIKGPGELPEGEHKLTVTGSAVFSNQPRSFTLADVPLRVVKPLVATVTPAGPIAANGTQKVKVSVTRFGEDNGPVAILFKNLPAGVTAPAAVAIPPGMNEIDVDLTAAGAAPGKIENLAAVAVTLLRGAAVTVESAPAVLEVAAQ
jgi:hypothetical protein